MSDFRLAGSVDQTLSPNYFLLQCDSLHHISVNSKNRLESDICIYDAVFPPKSDKGQILPRATSTHMAFVNDKQSVINSLCYQQTHTKSYELSWGDQ